LQVQHAISASHIENAWKKIVELQAQFLQLNMGNLPINLEIVRAKVDKLQVELMSLSKQHGGFAANLDSAKQDISNKTTQVMQGLFLANQALTGFFW